MSNIGATQVSLILSGLSNAQVLVELQKVHPNKGTKNTVAWYRSHVENCKKGKKHKLGKELVELVRAGPTQKPEDNLEFDYETGRSFVRDLS